MSFADYSQCAEDHQCMLVLVRPINSQLKQKTYSRLYERVSRLQKVSVPGQQPPRHIALRYKKSYPLENNEWGDFQAHRKVLGLLCLAQCRSENELMKIYQQFDDIRQQYAATLFDSRLIVFGLNRDGSALDPQLRTSSTSSTGSSGSPEHKPLSNGQQNKLEQKNQDDQNSNISHSRDRNLNNSTNIGRKTATKTSPTFTDPLNANALNSDGAILEEDEEEEEDEGGFTNSKTGASGIGNHLPKEANSSQIIFYPSLDDCADLEEKIQEFVSSLFWVLESKRLDRSNERLDKLVLLTAPFEKKDFVGIDTDSRMYKKRCQGRLKKHLGDLCLLAGHPGEAMLHYQTCLDILKSASDWLWLAAAYEGLCSASVIVVYPQLERPAMTRNLSFSVKRGSSAMKQSKMKTGTISRAYPNGLDLAEPKPNHCLLPSDIIDRYKEAVLHYSKFKNAGIIELEASMKACRVLIQQQKYLEASEFLQNIVYINLELSEDEKIQRYTTLSQLYGEVGMHRKASFFKRIAAMQCVAASNPQPAWMHCYNLLLQSLEGYRLSLDPKDMSPEICDGWPVLQLRVMHELIYSARRMGNPALAIRHLSFVLQSLFDTLSLQERKEITDVLESYTAKCEGTPQSLALDNGTILPPVPLLKFPMVKVFKLLDMPPHLRPVKLKKTGRRMSHINPSPFIYSPLVTHPKPVKPGSQVDFQWVVGDMCEVLAQVSNPLPFELKVTYMGLLTDGAKFEACPTSLSLPAESGVSQIKMIGIPREAGEVTVLGYSSHVLGCRSNCRLRDMHLIPENMYEVEVVPALPQLQVATSLPKAASFTSVADSASVVTSATTVLYAGQSCECQITLSNTGKQPIEVVEFSLDSRFDAEFMHQMLVWNEENLQSQLPLQPNSQASLTLYLHGASSFITFDTFQVSGSQKSDSLTRSNLWSAPGLNTTDPTETVIVESLLKLQYSGGPGLAAQYCRQCAIALTVEILPSLKLDKWDVLPSQSCDDCNLVLDLQNISSHQMVLTYGGDGNLELDSQQCKRISMLIPKCNIEPFVEVPTDGEDAEDAEEVLPSASELLHKQRTSEVLQQINNFVDVRWQMTDTDVEGRVDLEKLSWTDAQLDLLHVLPLQWRVKIGQQVWDRSTDLQFSCGEPVEVKFSLKNLSERILCDAVLSVSCCQDQRSGVLIQDMSQQAVNLGPTQSQAVKISEGEKLHHACTYTFLSPGRYNLQLSCSGFVVNDSSSCGSNNDRDNLGGSQQSLSSSSENQAGASLDSRKAPQPRPPQLKRSWKHIPAIPLSITVEDSDSTLSQIC